MPSKRKRPAPNVDHKNEEQELSTPVPSKKKKKAPYDPVSSTDDFKKIFPGDFFGVVNEQSFLFTFLLLFLISDLWTSLS